MLELKSSQFHLAHPLFSDTRFGVLSGGTLEGGHPGRIFVDDPQSPKSALLCTRVGYYFFGGSADNPSFTNQLYDTFCDQLAPEQLRAIGDPQVLMFYPSPDWKEILFQSFTDHGAKLIHKKRLVLAPEVIQKGKMNYRCWREQIPAAYRMRRMNEAFFREHPEMAGEAELFWGSVTAFSQKSLGYCLVEKDSNVAAAVCSAVFIGAQEAEISISTAPQFRRQGLGLLTAQAFIEACLKHALNPVWGCFPENLPSLAMAQKLGFVEDQDQPICFWEWRN